MAEDTQTRIDPRVGAILRVIRGESIERVAADLGFEAALLERWLGAFLQGGAAAVAGQAPTDPAARDRFLALISHEVRTPITVVSGWIDTLRSMPEEMIGPEILETALSAMRGHADRLIRLADDLLDSAAVSMGRLNLKVGDVDLSTIAHDVTASMQTDRLDVEVEPGLTMRGDGVRLGQVLTNLLNDAMGRTSGRIRVHVGAGDVPDFHVVRVVVPGPPPAFEEMMALFEPFDRGTGGAHSGLGLYVCRALAVAHGGQCGVDADEDHLTFWVRLPVTGPSDG